MYLLFKKKGSLEISIQAIVIVVLAMTLLGLGLGFIRGMFKNISGTADDVQEQVRQKILDDLITGDKKVSFPKTEIQIDKGGSTVLTVGIRNKGDNKLFYRMQFTAISGPDGSAGTRPYNPTELDNWFQFSSGSGNRYELDAADSDVRNIRISIPTSALTGSYFLNFEVIDVDTNEIYASKDFFIVVRG
jgi:hypothetical protein